MHQLAALSGPSQASFAGLIWSNVIVHTQQLIVDAVSEGSPQHCLIGHRDVPRRAHEGSPEGLSAAMADMAPSCRNRHRPSVYTCTESVAS